ncbi:MAG: hypothetical protein KC613_13310, partial [Myxococcales bacterium]|nr:hypothetical protein [Myxococcales bacterium]
QGGLAEHSYPAGAYRAYTIQVIADDGHEGTAEVELVVDFPEPAPNTAPVIETARELSRDGFNIVIGATANDADGDQLTYTVEWGDGSRPTTMRGGIAEHSYRNNVYRAYTVTVTVTDGRGGQATRQVIVNFAPPAENQAPEFEFVGVISKQGFQVTIAASAVDPDGDVITYTVLWGDGTPEMALRDQQATHRYPDGLYEDYIIRVLATDGQGGQAVRDLPVAFREPGNNGRPVFTGAEVLSVEGSRVMVAAEAIDPDGDPIRYTIEWGDGSPEGEVVGGIGEHEYPAGRFGQFTIRITAHDGNGASQTVELVVNIRAPGDNNAPHIDEVQALPQAGFEAVVLVDASDPDGDPLTYTVSWGDGTEPVRGGQSVIAHSYPVDIYRSYTVTITVEDSFGGRAVAERQITFPRPAANQPPVIEGVDVQVGVRGEITLRITASDPEEAGLVYAVQWGDVPGWMNLIGGVGAHAYAWDAAGYDIRVRVTDLHGNAVFDRLHVNVVDAPTVVHDVRVDIINARQVRAAIVASDADGSGMLQYAFDFNGDGVYELAEQAEGSAVHTYVADGDYVVGIRVLDPWSGAWIERRVPVRIDMSGEIGDGAPIIGGVSVERGEGGCVDVQADAADPEEGVLSFTIGWGDGSNPDLMDDGAARHCYEAPAEGDGYDAWIEVRDEDGNVTRQDVLIQVVDQPTIIEAIATQVVGQGRYLVSVRATDADGADRLRYSFDFNGDGNPEVADSPMASAAFTYIAPGRFLVRVTVTDSWSGASVEDTVVVEYQQVGGLNNDPVIEGIQVFPGPAGHTRVVVDANDPDGDELTVAVHWGDEADEGALSPAPDAAAEHRYALPGEGNGYDGYVIVSDPAGGSARTDFRATVIDRPTVIDQVVVEDRGYGAFVFDVRAHDPDGVDRLIYAFDADADGTWDRPDSRETAALFQWDIAGPQTVRVRVTDTWSGASVTAEVTVQVLPWQDDNQPPVIHAIEVEVGVRGQVLVSVVASDPDGGALDYVIHWGDEANAGAIEPMVGQTGEHDYAYGEGSWRGYVLVTDGSGTSVRGWFDARLVDAPTIIREVSINRVRDGVVMVNVLASDADGADYLRYSFDFDNDGTWDIERQINPNALHEFMAPGAHTVRVGVTDSWSGVTVEGQGVIELPVWVPDALPPQIVALEVEIGAGGLATLTVEASDPEGGFLDVQVRWGDEADAETWEALVGFAGDHTYAFPAEMVPYQGTVLVTDPDGLTASQDFEARIVDAPTVIREVSVSVIRDGQVQVGVRATDPDTQELTYAFDFDHDGTFEIDGQAESSALHTFDLAGEYTFTVGVTDPWSGVSTTREHTFTLEPWIDEVPIADDHLEGEEGRCLVFRIGDEPGELETKIDPTVCDRELNPDAELWTWDFGDGTTARGSEVGHRYQDDGIYDVVITGGNPERPRRSRIQVFIANAAPQFITQPRTEAYRGELYQYLVRLEDQGPTDEIRLVLTRGPEGMVVGRGENPGEWLVGWEVPVDFDQATVEVELRATDGHTIDGEWESDEGEAVQNFEVQVRGVREAEPTPSDMGVDGGTPAFDEYTGSNCSCDVADDNGPDGTFLFLMGFGLLALRRRRRG